MSEPAPAPAPEPAPAPAQYTYDDFLMVLMELAREEESQFKIYGSGWRRKRFEVLDRFIVLFESGRPTIYPALLSVAKHLKGRK